MSHTNVIYTIIKKQDKFSPFPYPPLYQETDTDYICFTDNPTVTSSFWKIEYIDALDRFLAEDFLQSYQERFYIAPNQILLKQRPVHITNDSLAQGKESSDFLITVPDIFEILNETPDFENFVPTANPDGTYHVEPNPEYHNGPYDGHPFLLTIGVPVSNQIRTIRRCLDGIRPILEAIPSELLVIDTGSSDGTVEAATEYQARIVSFPWCHNMSAVRNFGIRNAKGAWYMSIDDDEWFEDVKDIIDFFQSGTYQNYLFASYIQRNYLSLSLATYDENPAQRIAKIITAPPTHFEGRIHDALTGLTESNTCYLKSIAHHTGFHRDSTETLIAKARRNLSSLYYDLYEYPKDLRYTYQIANEFNSLFQAEYAAAYLYRGLSVNQEVNDIYYQKLLASHLMIALYTNKNPALFSHAQTCLSATIYTASELALIHFMLFQLAAQLEYDISLIEQESAAYEYYRKEVLANPEQMIQQAVLHLDVCTNPYYLTSYQMMRFTLAIRKQDEGEAKHWLTDLDLTKASQGDVLLFCSKIIDCKRDDLIQHGLQKIMNYISALSREQIASFADITWKTYLADSQDYQHSLGFVFFQYFIADPNYDTLAIPMLYWLAILGEKLFLSVQKEEDTTYFTVFLNYITALYSYALRYYNPNRFLEDSPLLPENIRAAYHIKKALDAAEKRNPHLCTEELKTALHTFTGFQRGISLLLEQKGEYYVTTTK